MQTFGKKKNSVANATVRKGKGVLRVKVWEPILLLGAKRFQGQGPEVLQMIPGIISAMLYSFLDSSEQARIT